MALTRNLRLSLFVAVLFVILIASYIAELDSPYTLAKGISDFIWIVAVSSFILGGALILTRQPGNRIGALMLTIGTTITVSFPLEAMLNALDPHLKNLTAGQVLLIWFNEWAWMLFIAPILLIFLYFPTGQLLSPRWRWAVWLIVADLFLLVFIATGEKLWSGPEELATWPNPIGFLPDAAREWMLGVMIAALLFCVAVAVLSIFLRYRRSPALERTQLRWLMFAGALFFGVYIAAFSTEKSTWSGGWLFDYFFPLAVCLVPVSIGISILRYRLYNIDVTINRSLVIAAMTVMLAIPFAAAFFGLRTVLAALLGGQQDTIAALASTLVAGLLFNPAHRRARDLIDRRFYGLRFNLLDLDASQKAPDTGARGHHTGQTLGKYKLHDLLGKGGMGEVYRASENGNTLAVKILPGAAADLPEHLARFSREARLTLSLTHPNIVRMLDYGEDGGTAFMAMEYVEGEDLASRLRTGGALDLNESIAILRQIAAALDYAHQSGFIHRDIKPSNIMLRRKRDGGADAVLMDFGVAKVKESRSMLTGTGMVGTIDYMAPEQIRESTAVDGRADVYALGLVAYEILAGQPAFKGSPAQVMFMHLTQPPPDIRALRPGVPAATAEAITRALAKDPADRFDTAGAFAVALE